VLLSKETDYIGELEDKIRAFQAKESHPQKEVSNDLNSKCIGQAKMIEGLVKEREESLNKVADALHPMLQSHDITTSMDW